MNTSGSSSHTPETCAIKRAWLHNMHLTNDFDVFRCHIPHLTPTQFNGTLTVQIGSAEPLLASFLFVLSFYEESLGGRGYVTVLSTDTLQAPLRATF